MAAVESETLKLLVTEEKCWRKWGREREPGGLVVVGFWGVVVLCCGFIVMRFGCPLARGFGTGSAAEEKERIM
jgi:hypothetical protein